MRCSVVTGPSFSRHDCRGHPECQERLECALGGIPPGTPLIGPDKATEADLLRVHDPAYLDRIRERCATCPPGQCRYVDPDTYITRDSYGVCLCAAGSTVAAVEQAREGDPCFALVRPPGHHAGSRYAMGFCIINNVAVAAAKAVARGDRVAIVDWDVHHGNGTQDIFYDSGAVLYCSVHQEYTFPGTGRPDETGTGEGRGCNVNVPVPAGSTIDEYQDAFLSRICPAVATFEPDLLLVSAGQDILFDDPLGGVKIMPGDFITLTRLVTSGSQVPVAFVLEGGYGPSHGKAIAAICSVLGELPPLHV